MVVAFQLLIINDVNDGEKMHTNVMLLRLLLLPADDKDDGDSSDGCLIDRIYCGHYTKQSWLQFSFFYSLFSETFTFRILYVFNSSIDTYNIKLRVVCTQSLVLRIDVCGIFFFLFLLILRGSCTSIYRSGLSVCLFVCLKVILPFAVIMF